MMSITIPTSLMDQTYVNDNGGGGGEEDSSGDQEELTVLPRHTKVVVTGNNGTKSVLVGLHGVVKKAVGLGGWHWLVLTNGIEVKLQRNALSVIESPSGNEDDDAFELEYASDDTQKVHRSRHPSRKSTIGSPRNKTVSRSLFCDSQPKASFTTSRGSVKIDLSKLEMAALRRYWLHFNLTGAISKLSKEQLVDTVQRHFMSQTMDELQVIVWGLSGCKEAEDGMQMIYRFLNVQYKKGMETICCSLRL